MRTARILPVAIASCALLVAGCDEGGSSSPQGKQRSEVNQRASKRKAYLPHNDVEFRNYNDAQKLYDSPTTIIWCTTTWGNPSAPMVTVPVTGKLTSSSTTFFPPTQWQDRGNYSWSEVQQPSVDGMYHPNPPQYRFGFTPGHQYVDFYNMPTFCTTALSKFQRQQTRISIEADPEAQRLTAAAERQLGNGDRKAAAKTLGALETSK